MATKAYRDWDTAGRHWNLAYPLLDLASTLRGYGYVVGTLGNEAHLQAQFPEDHDPFSTTGWPTASPLGWIFADDIMEPPTKLKLPALWQLGAQLVADKLNDHAGMSWLKYINWTPQGLDCRHESWQPGHQIRPSSDRGHIHLSGRTDFQFSRVARFYDPVARIRAGNGQIPVLTHPVQSGGAPKFPGRLLVAHKGRAMLYGTDIKQWQNRMKARGWRITVDGWYGSESAAICQRFQRDSAAHHWPLAADSRVGPLTWAATWRRPVS